MINLSNELNVDPKQINECVLINEGDYVSKDQIIAQNKGLFGLFKSEVKSPIDVFSSMTTYGPIYTSLPILAFLDMIAVGWIPTSFFFG